MSQDSEMNPDLDLRERRDRAIVAANQKHKLAVEMAFDVLNAETKAAHIDFVIARRRRTADRQALQDQIDREKPSK